MGILSKPFVEAWINRYQDYVPLWPAKDTDQTSRRRRLRGLTVLAISVLVVILVPLVFFGLGTADAVVREGGGAAAGVGGANGVAHSGGGRWRKPDGLMVVALVFYGRRANVQILERYLRKNLVDNGGILDRVHFISQVRFPEDADFLNTIIESNPTRYTFRDFGMMNRFGNYTGLWDHDIDPDTIYIKIDDDIVYISDTAIPDLVSYKLTHPDHLFVSANIINHPRLTKLHMGRMASFPFAPEHAPAPHALIEWKTSLLPTSPVEFVGDMSEWPAPPEYKHRWLPMRGVGIDNCPMRRGLNCSGVGQWQCATIAHYSLFYNLEYQTVLISDNEHLYDFGVWDIHGVSYDRWSINFFAAWGHEIIAARPFPEDDEQHLSADYPQSIRKHCVAVGSALVSHLSYYWQGNVVNSTDVLDRYKALVMDRVGGDLLVYDY